MIEISGPKWNQSLYWQINWISCLSGLLPSYMLGNIKPYLYNVFESSFYLGVIESIIYK